MHTFTPPNMQFTGNPATGKTTTVAKYFEHMKNKYDEKVETILINCIMNRTQHRIYTRIHEELIGKLKVENGLNTFNIHDSLINYLIKNNKVLFVVLDDYNNIKSRDLDNTLYSLSRAYENREYVRICVITITNSRNKLFLSPALESSLQPTEVYLMIIHLKIFFIYSMTDVEQDFLIILLVMKQ